MENSGKLRATIQVDICVEVPRDFDLTNLCLGMELKEFKLVCCDGSPLDEAVTVLGYTTQDVVADYVEKDET